MQCKIVVLKKCANYMQNWTIFFLWFCLFKTAIVTDGVNRFRFKLECLPMGAGRIEGERGDSVDGISIKLRVFHLVSGLTLNVD